MSEDKLLLFQNLLRAYNSHNVGALIRLIEMKNKDSKNVS